MQDIFIKLFKIQNNWDNVLYIHTPFCSQRCKYCVYYGTAKFTQEDLSNFYKRTLPRQIKEYNEIFKKVKFREIFFGGGTPTIAKASVLERIYNQIPYFENIPIKSIEANPYTTTDEHIGLFIKYKFSYVSLGIQAISGRILTKNNRLFVAKKRLKEISQKFEKTNIVYNFDLICYLDKEDERDISQFRKDLEYVTTMLRPISITIHSNYRAKKSEVKRRLLICLIRELISKYPEYKCVNSLLQMKDVKYDMRYNAEYRLMRKSFDFFNYLWFKYPTMPPYGNNIISLGSCDKLGKYVDSNVGICSFRPRVNKIYPIGIRSFKKTNFDLIRRDIDLPYRINKRFFINNDEKKKFVSLLIPTLSKTSDIINAIKFLNKI